MKCLKVTAVLLAFLPLVACGTRQATAPSSLGAQSVSSQAINPGVVTTMSDQSGEADDAPARNLCEASSDDDGEDVSAHLTVSPKSIQAGSSATLTWSTDHAQVVKLDQNIVRSDGSQQIQPSRTTTYVLTACSGQHVVTSKATITVGGIAPPPPVAVPSASLTASVKSIQSGQSSTLSWTTSNASSVTLNGGAVAVSGSSTVSPTATTTYTLNATNASGSASSAVIVTVTAAAPPPD